MKENWSIVRLIEIASEYDSVLDIGCGSGSTIKRINAKERVGIDICHAAIRAARVNNNGVEFVYENLSELLSIRTFECVIGVDIIEHFEMDDAIKLLEVCEATATKNLMFFVPVGNHPQIKDDRGFGNNYFQTHRSTWYPEDMEKLGYEVDFYPDWHKNAGPEKDKGAMWCRKILE